MCSVVKRMENYSELGITEFFGLWTSSSILNNTFLKLDLFPSSGEEMGDIYCTGPVRKT
jgi:hypothetical protein